MTVRPDPGPAVANRTLPTSRVVVKIGSSSLRSPIGHLDRGMVATLSAQLGRLRHAGSHVVLVSSGAVAAGVGPLGLGGRPMDLPGLQAAASVGQGALIHSYAEAFAREGLVVGQILLTPDDVVDRGRYLNARTTFERLLEMGAVPVVNENDTVVTDELRFGDNDRLAALVASMLDAPLLVLLSDVDGLYDDHPDTPGAALVPRVDDLDSLDARHYGSSGSAFGTGGMSSKLEAARIATLSGAHVVIANARQPDVVAAVTRGDEVGTWFPPGERKPGGRKRWIAFARLPHGRLGVDAGAVRALTERGSSLLAAGITDVAGEFGPGDAVEVAGPAGHVIARGLVAFDAESVRSLKGRSTGELDPAFRRAVIHRDSMVVFTSPASAGSQRPPG
jgi:glutamate 5-kinase